MAFLLWWSKLYSFGRTPLTTPLQLSIVWGGMLKSSPALYLFSFSFTRECHNSVKSVTTSGSQTLGTLFSTRNKSVMISWFFTHSGRKRHSSFSKFSFVLFYRPQDEQIHHLKKEIKLIFACQKILYNFLNTDFCTAWNRNEL